MDELLSVCRVLFNRFFLKKILLKFSGLLGKQVFFVNNEPTSMFSGLCFQNENDKLYQTNYITTVLYQTNKNLMEFFPNWLRRTFHETFILHMNITFIYITYYE